MDSNSTEFIAEAQEVIETFSRSLLELETQSRSGNLDPDLINGSFRAVHSLKGLAGLFGATSIGDLSHALENTLDSLRLGKLDVTREVLDVLFEAIELFGVLLMPKEGVGDPDADLDRFLGKLQALTRAAEQKVDNSESLEWIGEAILGVLTEYEEHRLRENLKAGRNLYRVHAAFDILAIDVGIETLKEKLKAHGEVITYLPSVDGSSDDSIELDILVGSDIDFQKMTEVVADQDVTVHRLAPPGKDGKARPPAVEDVHVPVSSSEQIPDQPEPEVVVEEPKESPRPSAREDAQPSETSLRSLSQTVRVDLRRLDVLMNLVGELGLVQANLGGVLDLLRELEQSGDVSRELQVQIRDMTRKLALLQQGILDVRMVPIGQVFDKLARVVRKVSRELDKEIRLMISGERTVLDKLIVEELSDPLMHMIRNCIDHGIEAPAERVSLGKQQVGRIELRAFPKGNRVVIEVEDDGRGMNWQKIRDAAVRRGVITADDAASISPQDALNLVFTPGFSTRDQASTVSGRGVGMDVVRHNIAKISGMIDVSTEVGRGTLFSITLPVTLAIIQALVIQSAGHTFCIPLNAVLESIMVESRDIGTVEGHEVITLRGKTLPLLHLSRLFELQPLSGHRPDPNRVYVVVVGLAQHRVGLVVDELLGQQDVVIKPLGTALRNVPGIAGATELGANRTVLLLDVGRLVDEGAHIYQTAETNSVTIGGALGG